VDVIIKQLKDGEWHITPNETFRGILPGALLLSFDETDTVCEITTTHGVCYWCGKEKYAKVMREKNPKNIAWLCRDAAMFYPDYKEAMERIIDVFGCTKEEDVPPQKPPVVQNVVQTELQL